MRSSTSNPHPIFLEEWRAFVAKKEAEAVSAALWPLTTETVEHPIDAVAIGNDWTRTLFGGDFYVSPPSGADLPSTSLVFVQSRDGNTWPRNSSTLVSRDSRTPLILD